MFFVERVKFLQHSFIHAQSFSMSIAKLWRYLNNYSSHIDNINEYMVIDWDGQKE